MSLRSSSKAEKKRIQNKTLIEYAIEYVESNQRNKEELWKINYVRLKKKYYYHAKWSEQKEKCK